MRTRSALHLMPGAQRFAAGSASQMRRAAISSSRVFRICPRDEGTRPELSRWLGGARFAVQLRITQPDSDALTALQVAWATMSWLVDAGCFAVFDVGADRWWSAAALRSWGDHRPLSVARELSVEEGTVDMGGIPTRAWVVRGLARFGRPEFVLQLPESTPPAAGRRIAMGVSTRLRHPVPQAVAHHGAVRRPA